MVVTGAQTKARLASLEAGRGLAASAVVIYHAARHLDKAVGAPVLKTAFQFGHAGVDFFFVISGFIILWVHAPDIGRPARLGHYAQRRFSRVMPTYWVALAATLALQAAGQRHEFPSVLSTLWSALLLPSHTVPLLGVAWTLQYEIVFYAVFGVLILSRAAGAAVFALWAAWIVSGIFAPDSAGLPDSLNGTYNLEFFAGMAVAFCLARRMPPAPLALLALGCAGFAAAGIAEDFRAMDGYGLAARFAYGGAACLIVVGAAACDLRRPLRVPATLRVLGAASYSIYLFQFVFIGPAWKALVASGLSARLPVWGSLAFLAGVALVGGVLVSRLVEYPLMRWARRNKPEGKALLF